ncbi:MAG: Putative glycosyltransferase (Group 1) [Methanothrix harundinacea]|uniref:Putative glycosyltransferase (Group 1) n=1 Tax=Methanothrix harundinacea TaxID=301375 RepID=A0A101IGH7_9EURY|nr:MAG: Putative glycosyltransferase (Group 1) [Methanothrix harundinacea]
MGLKILMCCNAYPPNFIGGAELVAHEHAKILKNLGHDVAIFAGDGHIGGKRYSIKQDTYDGLPVYRISLTPQDYQPEFINFTHKEVEENFKCILDEFSPDIVHLHNIIGLSVGLIHIAKCRGIKTVLTAHDHWGFCYKNTILKHEEEVCNDWTKCDECMPFISDNNCSSIPIRMRRDFFAIQFRDVDAFISPSIYLADAYIRAGMPKEKFNIVWNGIDVTQFSNITKKSMDNCIRFTYIGYFGRHKGIHTLINALPFINDKDKFKVNLIGTGELFDSYRRQVKETGVDSYVKFWGRIKNIEDAYRETDVFILPSIWPENQPVTITEAMASKTPVIASDIGGNPELVEDGVTGFLFKTGDERDLAEKMSHFISNPDIIKKFGENAYNKIKSNTLENRIAEILQVYDGLGPNEYGLEQKDFLIVCVGDCIDSCCLQAISLISNRLHGKSCRFVMSDWLQEDQFNSVRLLWIVGNETKQNEVTAGLACKIPLLVPENNEALKKQCIDGKCGLYYKDATDAMGCIEYLIDHEETRAALAQNRFIYHSINI